MPHLNAFKAGLDTLLDRVMSIGGGGNPGAYGGRGKDVFSIAIHKRRVLEIRYEGQVGYLRIEPYAYGRTEYGPRFLLAFRIDPAAEGWITLAVADIVSACLTSDTFDGQRPRPAAQFESTIAELSIPA